MWRWTAFLILIVISIGVPGCGVEPSGIMRQSGGGQTASPPGSATEPTGTSAASRSNSAQVSTPGQGSNSGQGSTQAQSSTPAQGSTQGVTRTGDDLEVALPNITNLVWSPSGRRAILQTSTRNYLLETEKPDLTPLPLDSGNIGFWSETELLWTPRGPKGDLMLRDLTTGKDRLLHPAQTPLIHTLKPGDQHLIYLVSTGAGPHGIFGKTYWTRLGDPNARLLLEESRLIGRMANGSTIAIGAIGPAGPLWIIDPKGTQTQVNKDFAHFPAISPDGKRLLWFTGPAPKPTSWLDLLKPAVAHAGEPYDPPLTDLWVWEGSGEPTRFPLGCACSADAIFSPDSRRIAISINEAHIMDQQPKPGRIAVVEGGTLKEVARFDDRTTAPIWLGNDRIQIRPAIREKTGGMPPLLYLTLDGKVNTDPAGMWFMNGPQIARELGGDRWATHWKTGETAEYRRASTENPNRGISVTPRDPYIALIWEDRAILRKVTWK